MLRVTNAPDGYCALLLIEDSKIRTKRKVGYNLTPGRSMEWSLDEGLSGMAIMSNQTIYVKDVRSQADYFPINTDTKSSLTVPLVGDGSVIGALSLESPKIDAFDIFSMQALEMLGKLEVIALEKSQRQSSKNQFQTDEFFYSF
jgi:hypothetical protein